jgi:hypothetical protein
MNRNDRKALKRWKQFVATTLDPAPPPVRNECDPVRKKCATPRKRSTNKPLIINIIHCTHASEKNHPEKCANGRVEGIR